MSAAAWTCVSGGTHVALWRLVWTRRAGLGGSVLGVCLSAPLTAMRGSLRGCPGSVSKCAELRAASSAWRRTTHPSPGPSRAAPPPVWEAPPRRRPCCSDPYPLLLLPDSGLHPGENLDSLLHHLLPGSCTDPWPLSQTVAPKSSDSRHLRRDEALATVTRDTTQGAPRQPGPPPLPNWLLTGWGGPKGRIEGGAGQSLAGRAAHAHGQVRHLA